MTAEPSASLSDVCPSLPAGSNYVGSRLCYRRADDDAVSLCDAPQQASAPAKTPGLWSIPPVKRQAASRDACQGAKEPRSQGWRWDGARFKQAHGPEYRKVDGTVCARCGIGRHGQVQAPSASPPAPCQALMPSSHDHWHCACVPAKPSPGSRLISLARPWLAALVLLHLPVLFAMTIVLPPNPTFSIEVVCGLLAAPRKSSSARGRPAARCCSLSHIFFSPLDASA